MEEDVFVLYTVLIFLYVFTPTVIMSAFSGSMNCFFRVLPPEVVTSKTVSSFAGVVIDIDFIGLYTMSTSKIQL